MNDYYTPNRDPNFWDNDNDELFDANCGSYALDVIEWYRPYDYDEEYGEDIIRSWDNIGTFDEALFDSTRLHAENILEDFDDIRLVHNINEVGTKERLILYREGIFHGSMTPDMRSICEDITDDIGWDWDFHFIWRDTNGKWHEKLGANRIHDIEEPSFDEPWSYGDLIYQGPVVMFAKMEADYAA